MKKLISMYFEPKMLEEIDIRKGTATRSAYVRDAVEREIESGDRE